MEKHLDIPRVIFLPRFEAENWKVNLPSVLISIRGSWQEKSNFKDGWLDILYLQFDDIECPVNIVTTAMVVTFTQSDADAIKNFYLQWKDQVDLFIVHCEAGISRSAAVAKWLAEELGTGFPPHYNMHNRLVYNTLKGLPPPLAFPEDIEE